jgi:hypothetical protein
MHGQQNIKIKCIKISISVFILIKNLNTNLYSLQRDTIKSSQAEQACFQKSAILDYDAAPLPTGTESSATTLQKQQNLKCLF